MYKNILVIDENVLDANVFFTSVNEDTLPIMYSSPNEVIELLNPYAFERLGLVFTQEMRDLLQIDLVPLLREKNVNRIDFLACNTLHDPEWDDYYKKINDAGVIVGASDNYTGNIKYGGDWIMESTSEDIETIYFTSNISYYSYLLGGSYERVFISKSNGDVMAIGRDNSNGEFGIPTSQSLGTTNQFTIIRPIISKPILIKGHKQHTVMLCENGKLYATGLNANGQLGNGTTNNSSIFTLMDTSMVSGNIISIACGLYHTMILSDDGTMYGTGLNTNLQLGDTTRVSRSKFVKVYTEPDSISGKIISIDCGSIFTVALSNDGTFYGWGGGLDIRKPYGDYNASLSRVNLITNGVPVSVSCGDEYTLVLTDSGSLYGMGYSKSYALGLPDTPTDIYPPTLIPTNSTGKIIAVSTTNGSTSILSDDGTIYCCGNDAAGELGIPPPLNTTTTYYVTSFTKINYTSTVIPKAIVQTSALYVLMSDNTIWGAGLTGLLGIPGTFINPIYGQYVPILSPLNVQDVSYMSGMTPYVTSIINVGMNVYNDTDRFINVQEFSRGRLSIGNSNSSLFVNTPIQIGYHSIPNSITMIGGSISSNAYSISTSVSTDIVKGAYVYLGPGVYIISYSCSIPSNIYDFFNVGIYNSPLLTSTLSYLTSIEYGATTIKKISSSYVVNCTSTSYYIIGSNVSILTTMTTSIAATRLA